MSPTRAVTWVGGGVLALVVIAAVVVLLAENRTPASFPAGSPQAALQGYLAAWEDRDLETAYGYFSDSIRSQVTLDEYETAVRGFGDPSPGNEAVFIDATQGSGDRVTVHLTVEHYSGDGPGAASYRTTTTVEMAREPDGWKLDEQLIGIEQVPFGIDGKPL
ncbi:MAG TPA: nuclear transport factor 2 family protein [Candidatus Limnocylindria bacterium]|jgi:hypothetical protein|nr:nuclear transport factor 2 family protein [Candidatus Limnocylindria bacterium]